MKRFLVVPLLLAVACRPPTPVEQLATIGSWIATARMAGDAWLRRTTPDKYTHQTLELSDRMLLQSGAEFLKSPPPTIDSAVFANVLIRTRFQVREMARLVEQKAAPEFRQPWDSLRIYQQIVRQASARIDSSR